MSSMALVSRPQSRPTFLISTTPAFPTVPVGRPSPMPPSHPKASRLRARVTGWRNISLSLEDQSPTIILRADTGDRVAHWTELDFNSELSKVGVRATTASGPQSHTPRAHRRITGMRCCSGPPRRSTSPSATSWASGASRTATTSPCRHATPRLAGGSTGGSS
jgi:hypothetical protein